MPSARTRWSSFFNSSVLGGVHAGGRLVQRQQLRLGGERARDFQPPLVAVGQLPRHVVGARGDADYCGAVPASASRSPPPPRVWRRAQDCAEHAGAGAHMPPIITLSMRGQVAEQADILEGTRNAARRYLIRPEPGERLAGKTEAARIAG